MRLRLLDGSMVFALLNQENWARACGMAKSHVLTP